MWPHHLRLLQGDEAMSEYTPMTEDVRRTYTICRGGRVSVPEFDRWLTEVVREAEARALEEAADVLAGYAGTILNAESASDIVRARAAEIREGK